MFDVIIGALIGLVVGWNLLPQPQWAKDLWTKYIG